MTIHLTGSTGFISSAVGSFLTAGGILAKILPQFKIGFGGKVGSGKQ